MAVASVYAHTVYVPNTFIIVTYCIFSKIDCSVKFPSLLDVPNSNSQIGCSIKILCAFLGSSVSLVSYMINRT